MADTVTTTKFLNAELTTYIHEGEVDEDYFQEDYFQSDYFQVGALTLSGNVETETVNLNSIRSTLKLQD